MPMNRQAYYSRIRGLLAPERLQSKTVVVVGLGSGGCRVAAELARLGIDLILVERPGELLEEHNIVRHLLGYPSLGKSKLSEMARYVRKLNPECRVSRCSLDVVRQKEAFGRRLEQWRPDLLAVCTDNEQSKHALNQLALPLGLPQVGAGVYDGGIGGEVYRVNPGQACYGCIAEQLQLQRHTAEEPTPDYSSPEPFAMRSTCALNLDIEQIALMQSRVVLDTLLKEPGFLGLPPNVNLLVFANRVVPGTFRRPLHCDFYAVNKKAACLDCGQMEGDVQQEADKILTALGAESSTAAVSEK